MGGRVELPVEGFEILPRLLSPPEVRKDRNFEKVVVKARKG